VKKNALEILDVHHENFRRVALGGWVPVDVMRGVWRESELWGRMPLEKVKEWRMVAAAAMVGAKSGHKNKLLMSWADAQRCYGAHKFREEGEQAVDEPF
jgi:hypothetical protein